MLTSDYFRLLIAKNDKTIFRPLDLGNSGIVCCFADNTEKINLCLREHCEMSDICSAELSEYENC